MPQEADSSRRTSQVGLVRRLPCTAVSQCNLSMLQQSYMECATGSVPCSAQAGRAYLHICSNATELRDDFLAQPLAHNTIASGSLRAGSCIGGRRLVVFAAMAGMCWLPAWRAQNASRVLGNAAPHVPAEQMRPLLRSSAPRMYMKMGRCEPSTGADRSTLATAPEETGRHAAERSAGAREKAAAMGMAFPRLPALNLHLHACNSNCAPAVLACSLGKQLHTALNLAAAALPAVCADLRQHVVCVQQAGVRTELGGRWEGGQGRESHCIEQHDSPPLSCSSQSWDTLPYFAHLLAPGVAKQCRVCERHSKVTPATTLQRSMGHQGSN